MKIWGHLEEIKKKIQKRFFLPLVFVSYLTEMQESMFSNRIRRRGWRKMRQESIFNNLLVLWIIVTTRACIIETLRFWSCQRNCHLRIFIWLIYSLMHIDKGFAFSCLFQPENLLLDSVGNLRISDFGLSALSHNCRVSFFMVLCESRSVMESLLN